MTNTKMEICIIGLGKFGLAFGKYMMQYGQVVVGIDKDPDKVKRAQHDFSKVYQADATDKNVLMQLGIPDFKCILVSVGNSITSSSLISMHLKEIGVQDLYVKAINEDHEKLLNKIGVTKVIIPDDNAAYELANKIVMPGFIDFLPFDENILIKEFKVNTWSGKTLRDLNLIKEYGVQVIALRKDWENKYRYIPKADDTLAKNDVLILLGHVQDLEKITS